MRWGVLKCAVVGTLACAVVSCGGSSKVSQSNGSANGSTGGTAGSTGSTTGGTTGSTGSTTGDTTGSTGGAGGASQLAVVIPTTTCPQTGEGSTAGLMILVAYDRPVSYTCDLAATCTSYKDLTTLALIVANYDLHGAVGPVGTGTYPLSMTLASAGTIANAQVGKTDASCAPVNPSGGAGTGSITIDSVTASAVKGSYDVTVNGTRYSGAIDAIVCPGDIAQGDICSGNVHLQTCAGDLQCL